MEYDGHWFLAIEQLHGVHRFWREDPSWKSGVIRTIHQGEFDVKNAMLVAIRGTSTSSWFPGIRSDGAGVA
jgi:hypothetical protein